LNRYKTSPGTKAKFSLAAILDLIVKLPLSWCPVSEDEEEKGAEDSHLFPAPGKAKANSRS
jgi:hypothetical protein